MLNNIFEFYVDDDIYTIKLSNHAAERMVEREVSKDQVIDNILSLSLKDFRYLRDHSLKVIVINKETKVSVVLGFNREIDIVTVVTVIKKENPYVSKGTVRVNL